MAWQLEQQGEMVALLDYGDNQRHPYIITADTD